MLTGLDVFTIRLVIAISLIEALIALPHNCGTNNSTVWRSYPSVLYVWSGQDSSVKNAKDFIAVIDFDEQSLTYGSIIRVVPLVSDPRNRIGQANNEPHHSSISLDGKYYITGGLLSFLSKQKEIFVWKIPRNPKHGPQFLCGIDAPGACTDEFQPIHKSQFLVTMMCNEQAGSPGDIAVIDADRCTARSLLKNASRIQNFNPHGYGRLNNGSILVADYVLPITLTSNTTSKIVFRNTCRHFYPDGSLKRTIHFDFPSDPRKRTGLGTGIGFMELKTIPHDKYARGFACGTNTNTLYLFGPGMPRPLAVYDVSEVNGYIKRPSAGIVSIFPDGKRMIMTFQMRFVILVDITQPERPKFLRVFDFCTDKSIRNLRIQIPGTNTKTTFPQFCARNGNNVGTHVIVHPKGEIRFLVFNYFLKFGLAQFAGTRSVHAFKLNKDLTNFSYDHRFNPNFDFNKISYDRRQTFYSLRAYPHHGQYLRT
ncbi:hypothetical protein Bhyg_15204 [Pseudolycoriella hygida]|uniref:Uncharacterized protein n=1 Tax=Pseudolycoriella hygida TaxID=35572 RepID=A0A9Q0RY82_9DIPT|nr:hypothetical protein Bhyg_15204 [Pseudolycoriella hygida]